MQGDHGLAGAGRSGHARRAVEGALHHGALGGVEEDRPFLPGCVQGGLQLDQVLDGAEAALRVGMGERVDRRCHGLRFRQVAGGGIFQRRFRRLGRQVRREVKEAVFRRCLDRRQPVIGHADREQVVCGELGE